MPRITNLGADVEYPVVVVGAGPVGMTLASALGRHGVHTLVVEQSLDTTSNPRCNTTNARSMEYFRQLGVADRIRRAGLPLDHATDVVYCTSLTGWELARFPFSSSSEVLSGTAHEFEDWPTCEPQHRISQIFLEPILEEHMTAQPQVDLLRGWRAEEVEESGARVLVTLRNSETGEVRRVVAAFTAGCDGGASTVRRSIGAQLEGDSQAGERRLSVYFRSRELGPLLGDRPGWMYWWYGQTFRGSLLRLDGDSLYLCHARIPGDMDPEETSPDEALAAAVGGEIEHEKLQVVRWTARRLVADRFRAGRILLAGDAAHLWLPLGGFGMNTGIADAVGLAWRLSAVLHGWGGERLLDDYASERRSIGEATSRAALEIDTDMFAIAREPELHQATSEGARMRAEVGGLIEKVDRKQWFSQGVQFGSRYVGSPGIAGVDGETSPRAAIAGIDSYLPSVDPGARLPHVWRSDGTSIFDQLGTGFTLLRIGPNAPSADALLSSAECAGIPWSVLDVPETAALDTYVKPLVLVRPDLHVAWSSHLPPEEPGELLGDLLGTTESADAGSQRDATASAARP